MTSKKIHQQAQSLWGCTHFPFSQTLQNWEYPRQQEQLSKLENYLSLKSSGIISGVHGTGKSHLLQQLTEKLSPKQYHVLLLTHSTLRGPGLLRVLTQLLGAEPTVRREDNLQIIQQKFEQLRPLWPILILEEAQN